MQEPGRRVVQVVVVPVGDSWHERLSPQSMVVVDKGGDCTPYFAGLLDANGEPLYRFPEKVPMGFQGPQRMSEEEYAKWRFEQDGCHE